jgi:RNA polymerase sigma factor (sigma-70 family)
MDRYLVRKFGEGAVVQEALLAAFRGFCRFKGRTQQQLRGWLAAILAHRADDLRRRIRRRKRNASREVPLTLSIAEVLETRRYHESQEDAECQQDQIQAMKQAIARLSPVYQLIIHLHAEKEMPFEQIARVMKRTEAAVRKLWLRAFNRWSREAHAVYEEMCGFEQGMTG